MFLSCRYFAILEAFDFRRDAFPPDFVSFMRGCYVDRDFLHHHGQNIALFWRVALSEPLRKKLPPSGTKELLSRAKDSARYSDELLNDTEFLPFRPNLNFKTKNLHGLRSDSHSNDYWMIFYDLNPRVASKDVIKTKDYSYTKSYPSRQRPAHADSEPSPDSKSETHVKNDDDSAK